MVLGVCGQQPRPIRRGLALSARGVLSLLGNRDDQQADFIICDVTLRGIATKQTSVVVFVGSDAAHMQSIRLVWAIKAAQPNKPQL